MYLLMTTCVTTYPRHRRHNARYKRVIAGKGVTDAAGFGSVGVTDAAGRRSGAPRGEIEMGGPPDDHSALHRHDA